MVHGSFKKITLSFVSFLLEMAVAMVTVKDKDVLKRFIVVDWWLENIHYTWRYGKRAHDSESAVWSYLFFYFLATVTSGESKYKNEEERHRLLKDHLYLKNTGVLVCSGGVSSRNSLVRFTHDPPHNEVQMRNSH